MKTSEILVMAKTFLAPNAALALSESKERYICLSIDRAKDNSPYSLDTRIKCEAVKAHISGLLGRHTSTLEAWLDRYHYIDVVRPDPGSKYTWVLIPGDKYGAYIDRVQLTRHAWIDSLILEYQAKGD